MRSAVVVAFACLLCSVQMVSAQWNQKGSGDCGGNDVGCSAGPTPSPSRCFTNAVARMAVCWDNRASGDPANFRENKCSTALGGAWCTYKSVTADQCAGGGAPGRKYECTAGSQHPILNAEVGIYHVNPVRKPKTVLDAVQDCLNDSVCSQLASMAAAQIGISPTAIKVAKAAAFVSDAAQHPESEETHYSITPPPGYRVCRVNIRTHSVNPPEGDRASVFSITAESSGIAIYTWTPKQRAGGGRSWYDGHLTVTFVPGATPAEVCSVTGSKYNYGCRGGKGTNKGLPACSTVDL